MVEPILTSYISMYWLSTFKVESILNAARGLQWCTTNFSNFIILFHGYEKQNIIFIREKTTFFIGPALTFKPSHRQMPFPSFSSSPLTRKRSQYCWWVFDTRPLRMSFGRLKTYRSIPKSSWPKAINSCCCEWEWRAHCSLGKALVKQYWSPDSKEMGMDRMALAIYGLVHSLPLLWDIDAENPLAGRSSSPPFIQWFLLTGHSWTLSLFCLWLLLVHVQPTREQALLTALCPLLFLFPARWGS